MRDWSRQLARLLATGRPAVLVTVVEVLGSTPCAAGARLIVAGDEVLGTVGGGNLEFATTEQARRLAASDRRALLQSLPLGPLLSQCCGGRVRLLFERFDPCDLPFFSNALEDGGSFATRIDTDRYGRWHFSDFRVCGLAADLDPPPARKSLQGLSGDIWYEPVSASSRRVCILGGGHIGKALVHVLGEIECDILVVDPRPEIALNLAQQVRVVATDDPASMEEWWRPDAVAVIVTHSHELDYRWTSRILARGDAAWCGLIGSKTKRARFLRRLREDGLSDAALDLLVCPIGLPGLKTKSPGAVAIATAAQLLPLLVDVSEVCPPQSGACARRCMTLP